MVGSDLCRRAALSLLELHAGNIDEALSLGLILDDELGKRVAAVAHGREALRDQVLFREIWRLHDGGEFRVELPDDVRRRFGANMPNQVSNADWSGDNPASANEGTPGTSGLRRDP